VFTDERSSLIEPSIVMHVTESKRSSWITPVEATTNRSAFLNEKITLNNNRKRKLHFLTDKKEIINH
jgi:hypothetical protein